MRDSGPLQVLIYYAVRHGDAWRSTTDAVFSGQLRHPMQTEPVIDMRSLLAVGPKGFRDFRFVGSSSSRHGEMRVYQM